MEATASAAPATTGAGTASGPKNPPSQTQGGNSAASKTSPTQHQNAGAAQPSSTVDNQGLRDRGQQQSAPADDDPEFDFGERGKVKRSRVVEDFNRMRQSQAAEARRAAEFQKRAEAAEAYKQHLQRLGIDPDGFAKDPEGAAQRWMHDQVRKRIEEAQLDPQEREFRKRDAELKTREQQIAEQEQQRQKQEHDAQVQARADEWSQHMRQALETSALPRNPRTVARMAELVIAAERSGRRFPPQELAKRVAESISAEQQFHASTLADDPKATAQWIKPYLAHFKGDMAAFADAAGPEMMEALRKHILQQHESKFTPQKPQTQARRQPRIFTNPKQTNGYITLDEAREIERKQKRGI